MTGIRLRASSRTTTARSHFEESTWMLREGELLVVLGPSGCGKTTLLRVVAGLEEASAGSVFIGGRDVTDLAPARRNVSMVFQSYAAVPAHDRRRECRVRPGRSGDAKGTSRVRASAVRRSSPGATTCSTAAPASFREANGSGSRSHERW